MKKVAIVGIVAVLVLCIASQSVSAGLNSANVRGWITDDGGNPIVNATVEWENNETGTPLKNASTTSEGYYSMTYTFDGTIESLIIASKTGYVTDTTVITTTAGFIPTPRYEVNFTLEEEVPPVAEVVINEFSSYNSTGDWIELYNKGASEVPTLDGWAINDSASEMHAFGAEDSITADGYLVVDVNGRLNIGGDTITLLNSSGAIVDQVTYGSGADMAPAPGLGNSTGRHPDGEDTGNDGNDFIEFGTPTPGEPNELPVVVTTVTVLPSTATLKVGETQQFMATAHYSNSSTADVTTLATWESTNGTVGTISVAGLFTANATGTTTVKATYGGKTGTADVEVYEPVVTTITVDPSTAKLKVGKTQQFTATAKDQKENLMDGVIFTWTSSVPTVGTIDANGLFTAKAKGDTAITATNGTVTSDPASVAVTRVTHGGGGGGAPRDTDGDGYSDIQEMIASTDKDDPCDPDPECEACIATKPAATPTPTPTPTVTPTPTIPPVVTTPTPTPTPTPTEEPGFEAVFAIAGLLTVAYLVLRRKRK